MKEIKREFEQDVEQGFGSDNVSLEDEASSTKRSVLWFIGAFLFISAFFILAFWAMNLIQFPFSIGLGGPTGPTGK